MLELKTRRGQIRRLDRIPFTVRQEKGARELACHTFNALIFDAIGCSSNFLSLLSVVKSSFFMRGNSVRMRYESLL